MPEDVYPDDPNGVDWVQFGKWLEAWYYANTSTLPPSGDPLLAPICQEDTEGVKFAKLQRWLKAIREVS